MTETVLGDSAFIGVVAPYQGRGSADKIIFCVGNVCGSIEMMSFSLRESSDLLTRLPGESEASHLYFGCQSGAKERAPVSCKYADVSRLRSDLAGHFRDERRRSPRRFAQADQPLQRRGAIGWLLLRSGAAAAHRGIWSSELHPV